MNQARHRILITTGGTGGHLYPAIALGRHLEKAQCETLFALRLNESVAKTLSTENFSFVNVPSAPFFGQSVKGILSGLYIDCKGVVEGMKTIRRFNPGCVVGFGGYASVPVILSAFLLGKPVLLHEQNIVPGWANRFCAIFSKKVAVSYPETEKYFSRKAVLTGNLVRNEILGCDSLNSRRVLGLKENCFTILVFGGSAGAKGINQWVSESLDKLSHLNETVQFLHITGRPEETEKMKKRYKERSFHSMVLDFSNDMGKCYASADCAVCRAGATTLAELVATQTPAILIPYPHATNDHQKKNAVVLESLGAAVIVPESGRLNMQLSDAIKEMAASPEKLKTMRENYKKFPVNIYAAPQKLCDAALELIR